MSLILKRKLWTVVCTVLPFSSVCLLCFVSWPHVLALLCHRLPVTGIDAVLGFRCIDSVYTDLQGSAVLQFLANLIAQIFSLLHSSSNVHCPTT